MSESAGNLRALALSLLIHLLCVAVIAIGLFWTRTEAPLSDWMGSAPRRPNWLRMAKGACSTR